MHAELKIGTIIKVRYELLEELGKGGFGTVFRARDIGLERDVAIKFLNQHSTLGADHARFRREAVLLAQLKHKNLVSVYSFDILDDGTSFIVMKYLSGRSLRQLLKQLMICENR